MCTNLLMETPPSNLTVPDVSMVPNGYGSEDDQLKNGDAGTGTVRWKELPMTIEGNLNQITLT